MNRRSFLKGIAVLPVVPFIPHETAAVEEVPPPLLLKIPDEAELERNRKWLTENYNAALRDHKPVILPMHDQEIFRIY